VLCCCVPVVVAIGNAFAVLSCPEKRERYDRYGTEEEQVPVMTRRHFYHNGDYEYDFTRGFEGEQNSGSLELLAYDGSYCCAVGDHCV